MKGWGLSYSTGVLGFPAKILQISKGGSTHLGDSKSLRDAGSEIPLVTH